ncbi:MAG: restriction endonuclease subunit S [Deltaproteobacteria bacterium]|nr:restriction endonuclease subunit S [Deltaproteobacteria bacterium]
MRIERREVRLGELVSIRHGWPFKSEFFSEERRGRPVVVGIGNFRYTGGFRFESTTVKEYTGEYPNEYTLRPGDVLLVMTCQTEGGEILGIPGRIPDDGTTYLHNQRLGKVDVQRADLIDTGFLYWLFLSREFNQALCATASGTKIVHTAPSRIEAFRFALPPILEQRAIAAVLGAVDGKIDLNRRMNETLEETARVLFKSWFVDFDPVRAKAEGRRPVGMDAATAALFPDGFEDSEFAEMPKGWSVEPLKAILSRGSGEIQTGPFGSQLHASDYQSVGTPVVMPTNVANRRVDETDIARVSDAHVERLRVHRVRLGDVIYSRRGDVEKHALVGRAEEGWLCGTGCLRVRPGSELDPHFLSLWLDLPTSRAWIAARAVGATMPNLNTQILGQAPVLAVPHAVQAAFARVMAPIDDRVVAAREENGALTRLRDYLLPRLLSGEVRVRDAEKLVGNAT